MANWSMVSRQPSQQALQSQHSLHAQPPPPQPPQAPQAMPQQDPTYMRQVLRNGQVSDRIPPGEKAVTVIGQAGAGKSTVGNTLVCETPNRGPFYVSRAFDAQTRGVTSAWSDSLGAYVTDTPGLHVSSARSPQGVQLSFDERRRVSNQHMRSLTHFLNADGGYVVWVLPSTTVTSQVRGLIQAMNACDPSWPYHTMVVPTQSKAALTEDIQEYTRRGNSWLEEQEVSAMAADEHDRIVLAKLNESIQDLGVQFGLLTTFVVGHNVFTAQRLMERMQDLMRYDPLPPGKLVTWSLMLDSRAQAIQGQATEQQQKMEELSAATKAQEEELKAASMKFRQRSTRHKTAAKAVSGASKVVVGASKVVRIVSKPAIVVPFVVKPAAGAIGMFLEKASQKNADKAARAEASAADIRQSNSMPSIGYEQLIQQYTAEIARLEGLVSEAS